MPYSNAINFFFFFFFFLISDKNSHIRSLEDNSQVKDLPSLAKALALVPSPCPSNINTFITSEVRIHKENPRGSFEG